MRGKDDVGHRLLPAAGKGRKVFRLGQILQPVEVGRLVQRRDQPVQPVRAGEQPFAFQFRDQRRNRVQRQLAAFDPA